jgi:hypothetical protein
MFGRGANKTAAFALVDKVCELQRQLCEYERYVNNLAIMLSKGEAQTVRKHDVPYPADWVWDKIRDMVNAKNGIKVDGE